MLFLALALKCLSFEPTISDVQVSKRQNSPPSLILIKLSFENVNFGSTQVHFGACISRTYLFGSRLAHRQSASLVIKGSWVRILMGAKLFYSSFPAFQKCP